jgi:transposase
VTPKQIAEIQTFRKTTKEAAAANRALAVLLLVQDGDMSYALYTVDHARRLKYAYLRIGVDAFLDKRTSNRDRVLTKPEREAVVATLKARHPKDVITPCTDEHWSTYWLGRYIHEAFGKQYKSKTSHYLLFKEAKLSFHLPGKRYEKADQGVRDAWVKQQSDGRSRLMSAWRDPDTVILCEDEMVLTSATTLQKIWLPKRSYPPVIETNNTKKRKSIYGFLNLKTGRQQAFTTDWQNMYITVGVLEKLRAVYPSQKLLIVWDNCGWHRGSEVQKWIRKDNHTKTLHFPPYTPDLNPQEHVWKAGRKATTHNQHITDIEQATKDFVSYIEAQTFGYELCGLRPRVREQA